MLEKELERSAFRMAAAWGENGCALARDEEQVQELHEPMQEWPRAIAAQGYDGPGRHRGRRG